MIGEFGSRVNAGGEKTQSFPGGTARVVGGQVSIVVTRVNDSGP